MREFSSETPPPENEAFRKKINTGLYKKERGHFVYKASLEERKTVKICKRIPYI